MHMSLSWMCVSSRPLSKLRLWTLPSGFRITGATPPPFPGPSTTHSCASPLRVRTRRCWTSTAMPSLVTMSFECDALNLKRFYLVFAAIRHEIEEVKEGKYDTVNNVLKARSYTQLISSLFTMIILTECSSHNEAGYFLRVEPSILTRKSCLSCCKW